MYNQPNHPLPTLSGTHSTIFRGEADVSGYNNHIYLEHVGGRFVAIWSSSVRDGGHTGQRILAATSRDGSTWSAATVVAVPEPGEYLIARGLWLRGEELLALVARCTGEAQTTRLVSLDAFRRDADGQQWQSAGTLGSELINNYAPIRLASGEWLMPYRFRELNRVDGVLVGGRGALDDWRRIPFPDADEARFTEANAVIRADGSIAVHFRDNLKSGFLFRAVSRDGGTSFTAPVQTNFPDCRCKHYCCRLSNGLYVLINNATSRESLQISGSLDGEVFGRTAILRDQPPPVRLPGHDKGPSFSYPHAIEHDGALHIAYSVNRDDICVTRIPLATLAATLSPSGESPE